MFGSMRTIGTDHPYRVTSTVWVYRIWLIKNELWGGLNHEDAPPNIPPSTCTLDALPKYPIPLNSKKLQNLQQISLEIHAATLWYLQLQGWQHDKKIKIMDECQHNIIPIHNIVLWDLQFLKEYSWIFPTFSLRCPEKCRFSLFFIFIQSTKCEITIECYLDIILYDRENSFYLCHVGIHCKMDVKSTWTSTWHRMHVSCSLGLFSKTTSWRYA